MFEQSTLPNGPAGKRLWTTFIGLGGEVVVVLAMVLAPMIWPEVLPKAVAYVRLLPVPPPAPPGPPPVAKPVGTTMVVPPRQIRETGFFAPRLIPVRVAIIEDPPEVGSYVVGSIPGTGGSGSGNGPGVPGGFAYPAVVSLPPPPPEPAPPAPKPASIQRVRQGGLVKPAQVIRRVEPKYPEMALKMRLAGTVELEGVIGVDGRLRELKVLKSHPLFVRAALDAVSQWVYEPTTLNGDPVEVIAPITVTFRLN
jgi:periplasmic protein TonB